MATLETQQLDEVIASSRRRMLTLGGAALAGMALTSMAAAQTTTTLTDADYLNFALNLEYLEANFYTLAVSGQTIDALGVGLTGVGTQGTVTTKTGGPAACKVPFVNATVQNYAMEIAQEERNHVNFLRTALGSAAVAQPAIDLYNSFNTLAAALGIKAITSFDPFADDASFLLGSYIFEDVGVTAYTGAAPLLTSPTATNPGYLTYAAGIQAVEAYHAGLIRTTLIALDQSTNNIGTLMDQPAGTLAAVATAISAVRATLDGSGSSTNTRGDDLGVTSTGDLVILNGSTPLPASSVTNASTTVATTTTTTTSTGTTTTVNAAPPSGTTSGSLVTSRTPAQVLAIVYAGGKTGGGFFPSKLNGNIA